MVAKGIPLKPAVVKEEEEEGHDEMQMYCASSKNEQDREIMESKKANDELYRKGHMTMLGSDTQTFSSLI